MRSPTGVCPVLELLARMPAVGRLCWITSLVSGSGRGDRFDLHEPVRLELSYPDAAGSLSEGLDDKFTVASPTLRRSLSTCDAQTLAAVGMLEAERSFRRLRATANSPRSPRKDPLVSTAIRSPPPRSLFDEPSLWSRSCAVAISV